MVTKEILKVQQELNQLLGEKFLEVKAQWNEKINKQENEEQELVENRLNKLLTNDKMVTYFAGKNQHEEIYENIDELENKVNELQNNQNVVSIAIPHIDISGPYKIIYEEKTDKSIVNDVLEYNNPPSFSTTNEEKNIEK